MKNMLSPVPAETVTSGAASAIDGPAAAGVAPEPGECRLTLLGGFALTRHGLEVLLPASTWRVVALVALAGRPVLRSRVAYELWSDKDEPRAQANLRSALWRLRQAHPGLVAGTAAHLYLARTVRVDLDEFNDLARRLASEDEPVDVALIDPELFCRELLPDWTDQFVELERERIRQLRLHTLEALAARLVRLGTLNQALQVALTAVAAAPLRETAHKLVIEVHLAEGNISEALRHYRIVTGVLRRELGVAPSPAIRDLMAPWVCARPRAAAPGTAYRRA